MRSPHERSTKTIIYAECSKTLRLKYCEDISKSNVQENNKECVTLVFHAAAIKFCLLGYEAVLTGTLLPRFRRLLMPPSWQQSKNSSLLRRTGYIIEGQRMNDYSNRIQSITYRKENDVVHKTLCLQSQSLALCNWDSTKQILYIMITQGNKTKCF
jgi:hypothetical protein